MPELGVTEEQLERIESLRAELETAFVDGYGHVRRRDAVDYLLDTYTPPAEERVRRSLDRRVRDEDGEIDYPALQSVARNTEGVKGSGMPAEEMYAAVFEANVREAEAGRSVGLRPGRGADTAAPGEVGDATAAAADADAAERDDADASEGDGADAAERAMADVDVTDGDTPDAGSGSDEADGAAEVDEAGDATEVDEEADQDGADADDAGSETSPEDADEPGGGSSGAAASGGGGSQLGAMMNLLKTHEDKWRRVEGGDAPYEVDLPDGGTETARTKDDVKRVLFTNY